jgi:WD40 repeat protein
MAAQKLRVFLSYSRRDSEFVARLASALEARGYLPDFDRSTHDKDNVITGISAEDDWWKRLQEMIEAADVMVFVVSPASATSKVCDEEIVYARSLGKRVIPLLRQEIDFATAPPRLAALNVKIGITGDDAAAFDGGVAALSAALDRDVAWLREQTRLVLAAADWEKSGRRDEELLHGAEISEAEAWSARRPPNAPEISEQVLAFLAASRTAQGEREDKERRSLKRQRGLQRWVGGLTAAALAATLAGAWFVMQGQRELARRESSMLAIAAAEAFDGGQYDLALRLAMIAARETWLRPPAVEAKFELGRAAAASRLAMRFPEVDGSTCLDVRADGRAVLATGTQDVALEPRPAKAWMMTIGPDGTWRNAELSYAAGVTCARFARNGDTVVVTLGDGRIDLIEPDGEDLEPLEVPGIELGSAQMLEDGRIVAGAGKSVAVLTKEPVGWTYEILAPSAAAGENFFSNGVIRAADDGSTIVRQLSGGVRIWSRKEDGSWAVGWITTYALRRGAEASVQDGVTASEVEDGGHLQSVDLSRDGRRLMLIDGDMAEIWEQAEPGQWRLIESTPPDEERKYGGGALSPDGLKLAMDAIGGIEMLSQLKSGRFGLERIGDPDTFYGGLVFSADGTRLGASRGRFEIWNAELPLLPPVQAAPQSAGGVFSSDGSTLVTSRGGATRPGVEVWRLDDNGLAAGAVIGIDNSGARVCGFLADGRVFQVLDDGTIRIWRKEGNAAWRLETSLAGDGYPRGAAGGDKRIVVSLAKGLVVAEESIDGEWRLMNLPETTNGRSVGMSATGDTIAFADGKSASVWSRSAGGYSRSALGEDTANAVALSGDGRRIVTIGRVLVDGAAPVDRARIVKLWTQDDNGDWTAQVVSDAVTAGQDTIAISRDGRRIAAASFDGVWLWTQDGSGAWTLERVGGADAEADRVRLSPDGSVLATVNSMENMLRAWKRREDGKWVSVSLGTPDDIVDDVEFSPDGRSLAVTRLVYGSRIVDIGWTGSSGGRDDAQRMTADACAAKLSPSKDGTLRRISAEDVAAAPILRGREGEDVCAWQPAWYDRVLDAALGWMR